MKIIIAGGREFSDFALLESKLAHLIQNVDVTEVVSGGARGADRLGEEWANIYNYPVKKFPANWNKYGKSAGYKRNAEMAQYADCLVAFWDGKSRGTKHMIDLAHKQGLKVRVVNY